SFDPRPLAEVPFLLRAQTQKKGAVRVTVVVLSEEESEQVFGVDLVDEGIQPVWVGVENDDEVPFWFIPAGVDPEYFSPLEASYFCHLAFRGDTNARMDRHFDSLRFQNPVLPKTKSSGFVFTHLDLGTKAVHVDLVGKERALSFDFICRVPGITPEAEESDLVGLYPDDQLVRIEDEAEFRKALSALPRSTTDEDGEGEGDPLNLVVVGDRDAIAPAFILRGWHPTEAVYTGSMWKTFTSFVFGYMYRYSPVSPLYLFGRKQDIAGQKARRSVHERNHIRLWLTPIRYRDKVVLVGQISRDIGVRLTTKSWFLMTHKIDPDVDESRDYLIQDLFYSRRLEAFGYVRGVQAATIDEPRENLFGDPYFTDGLRAVLFLTDRDVPPTETEFLEWERPRIFPKTAD
ncbi:MAG: LssY C-terminal domain-containing protein, partial [Planctomycetota bacterium]